MKVEKACYGSQPTKVFSGVTPLGHTLFYEVELNVRMEFLWLWSSWSFSHRVVVHACHVNRNPQRGGLRTQSALAIFFIASKPILVFSVVTPLGCTLSYEVNEVFIINGISEGFFIKPLWLAPLCHPVLSFYRHNCMLSHW